MKALLLYFTVQLVLLACFMLETSSGVELDSEDVLHASSHIGASYLITHATEVICTKIAGKEHKLTCTVTGAIVAASAGIAKEVLLDKGESSRRHAIGYAEDLTGIGLAVTFITIDF